MKHGLLGTPSANIPSARKNLASAIEIHKKHMNGTLPTSGNNSQKEMMLFMEIAYQEMGEEPKNKLRGLLHKMD